MFLNGNTRFQVVPKVGNKLLFEYFYIIFGFPDKNTYDFINIWFSFSRSITYTIHIIYKTKFVVFRAILMTFEKRKHTNTSGERNQLFNFACFGETGTKT